MHATLVQALDAAAARAPAAMALAWHGVEWTFGDLATAVSRVRAGLAARQVSRGAAVGLLLPNSPHYVAAYYGALASGCIVVPLNAHERSGVLLRQIEHSGTRLVVGDRAHPEWPAIAAAAGRRKFALLELTLADGPACLDTFARELGIAAGTAPRATPDAGDPAAILYTSGTTGQPKGVTLSHGNLASNAAAIVEYLRLGPADRGLCVLPLHFAYGNSVLHSHLLAGARLRLEDHLAYPHLVLQRIQDEAITGFAGVPSTFAVLLARCRFEDFDLASLRYLTQAGGPMPQSLVARLRRALPGTKVFAMYGQTEATARLTYLPPERLDDKPGSVGIPVANVEIDIRQHGRSVPRGQSGEICARGPNVMLGYWQNAEATAAVLREGWLHTGDLGHLDADGYLFIDGRAAEMIKVGAYRVSPREVEEVIAALPGVAEVAAAAMPDELLGHAVKAVVVAAPGAALDARAIKAQCRQQLATYKIPRVVEFVEALPRTASGKVLRRELA
ncbi:MAG: long-chain-fatty-acid--CoA ligase [Nevskiales bacterium]